jgi:hypothetical protein
MEKLQIMLKRRMSGFTDGSPSSWGAMLLALQKHAIALAFRSLACFCKAKSMAPS